MGTFVFGLTVAIKLWLVITSPMIITRHKNYAGIAVEVLYDECLVIPCVFSSSPPLFIKPTTTCELLTSGSPFIIQIVCTKQPNPPKNIYLSNISHRHIHQAELCKTRHITNILTYTLTLPTFFLSVYRYNYELN